MWFFRFERFVGGTGTDASARRYFFHRFFFKTASIQAKQIATYQHVNVESRQLVFI